MSGRRKIWILAIAAVVALIGVLVVVNSGDSATKNTAAKSTPTPGATSTGTSAIDTTALGQPIKWAACPNLPQAYGGRDVPGFTFDCGKVAVPQDWHHPDNGKTFIIAVARARAAKQTGRIGSLLMNPGGPGGSGIELLTNIASTMPAAVTQRFDLVGFDPRGVGHSSPVKCLSTANEDAVFAAEPDPKTQAEFDQVVALNKTIGDECGAKYKDQLALYSTEQSARDIDALRQGVGDAKTNYLGFSYGTLLGATYAQLFPKNIRAMVLDGAVDPKQGYVAGAESQAAGFEHAFGNFAKWCKENASTCPIADDPQGEVLKAMDDARKNPITDSSGRVATAGMIMVAVSSAMYTQQYWQPLATTFGLLQQGDPRGVFVLADAYTERQQDGTYNNLFDVFDTVSCADAQNLPTLNEIRQDQVKWRQKYPLFGGSMAVGMVSCVVWPNQHDPYPTGKAEGAPPIIVVGTTGDPATPYAQTAKLANMLGVGEVLTWQGEGHTAYPQTPCISNAVDGYLINLKTPPANTVCPAKS
jgi:pimeloyl-ACP methyl ester carboxylesterase